MVKVSLAIMHHPRRAERLPPLLAKLGPTARANVVVDRLTEGIWVTAQRAWRTIDEGATHQLVLQDDVLPCRDFMAGVKKAIEAHPGEPLCFYANRAIIEEARALGSHWAVIPDGCWGQAPCLPVEMIEPFLAWCEMYVRPEFKWDDTRLALYLLWLGRPVWCTVPSLVEHLAPSDSLAGNNNRNRVARWYIGADESALDINWAEGGAAFTDTPTFKTLHKKYEEFFLKEP